MLNYNQPKYKFEQKTHSWTLEYIKLYGTDVALVCHTQLKNSISHKHIGFDRARKKNKQKKKKKNREKQRD